VAWAKAYLRTKWHLDPSSRLAPTDISRKLGEVKGAVPRFRWGSWVLISHNVAYLCNKWYLDPSSLVATIDMGQKLGGMGRGSWVTI